MSMHEVRSQRASRRSRRASSRSQEATSVPEHCFKLESENVYVRLPKGTQELIDAPRMDPVPPDWILPSTKVLPSVIDGYGVFAGEDIDQGNVVIEYSGKELTREQFEDIEKLDKVQGTTHFNIFEAGDSYIDGSVPDPKSKVKCPASYTNHSCFPNTVSKYASYNGRPKLFFVAEKRIRKGDEITLDYKINYEEGKNRIPCKCKSVFCKSWVDYRPDYDSAPDVSDENSLKEIIKTLRKQKRKKINEMQAAEDDSTEEPDEDSDEEPEIIQQENNCRRSKRGISNKTRKRRKIGGPPRNPPATSSTRGNASQTNTVPEQTDNHAEITPVPAYSAGRVIQTKNANFPWLH